MGREGQTLGALALFWWTPRFEPPQERIAALEEIAGACIPAIENARRYREARRQAETDALTGFFNQRYFHETLRREALRAGRYSRKLALLILDFDDFKLVNDRIGHLAGDAVLAQVAEHLRDQIRSVDIGCRIGGDEFAVILPESTAIDAQQLFDRMHAAIDDDDDPRWQVGPDLGRNRRATTRRDRRGPLRAGGYRAVPGEGVGQEPCGCRSRELGTRR